ncbi:MAG: translocation/assembly module TamB domain-containing protein [Gemmatimonadota bacterium]
MSGTRRRIARVLIVVVLAAVLLIPLAVLILTRTGFGRERARRYALSALRESLAGQVDIGSIDGDLLGRFTLNDLEISDRSGAPVLSAESATARLDVGAILSRRIRLGELTLVRPVIHLIQSPGGEWNYKRLLKSADTTVGRGLGFGDWINARNVSLRDGTLIVRRPYDEAVTPAERDSLVRGESRLFVEVVDYGLRQTMSFHDVDAWLSSAVIADPDSNEMSFVVDSLSMIAAPLRPPEFVVRHFSGTILVGEEDVRIRDAELRLPASRASGTLDYTLPEGDIVARLVVDSLAFSDIRGAYPPLPDSGGGRLVIAATVRADSSSEYTITDAVLSSGRTTVAGRLGLVLGEPTTGFRDTELRFTSLDTDLIAQLAPKARSPVAATLTGTTVLEGDLTSLALVVRGRVEPRRHAPFSVTARGGISVTDDDFSLRDLRFDARGVPTSLLREFDVDSLPVDGAVDVNGVVSGRSSTALGGRMTLTHVDRDARSVVVADGSVGTRGSRSLNVDLDLRPISLELLQRFAPETDLNGDVRGTIQLRGAVRDLRGDLNLYLPDSGRITGSVRLALPQAGTPGWAADVNIARINANAIAPSAPVTDLNGVIRVTGTGEAVATAEVAASIDLTEVSIDSSVAGQLVARARASAGKLVIDSMRAETPFAWLTARGDLGLTAETSGSLAYDVEVSDLRGLARWIGSADTATVQPRPGIAARLGRIAGARADSIERAAREDPAAQLAADVAGRRQRPTVTGTPVVPPVPRDSLSGSVRASGEASGSVKKLDATFKARSEGVAWGGNLIGAGSIDGAWFGAGTDADSISARGGLDSLRVSGFALDSTRFDVSWRDGSGTAVVSVFPGDTAEYRARAEYSLRTGEREVRLKELQLRFDSTAWSSTRPSVINWGGSGVVIDSLELRNGDGRGGGRIFVNGEVPDVDDGRIEVAVDSLRLAPWLTLTQSDLPLDGYATFAGEVTGTRSAPRLRGAVAVTSASYRGTAFPDSRITFAYADLRAEATAAMLSQGGDSIATLQASLPLDLRLVDSISTRRIDGPIDVKVSGDSIPLSPLRDFGELFTEVEGSARGEFEIAGTWSEPVITGSFTAHLPRLGIAATGVTLESVLAAARMEQKTLVIDSVTARSSGTLWLGGNVRLESLDRPVLDLALATRGARVLSDERGELFSTANLRLGGTPDTLQVRGHLTIDHGVVYIPDPETFNLISTDDPAVFAVVDTATARELDIAPTELGIVADIDLTVGRGTFARSSEANVEVFGSLHLAGDPTVAAELALRGTLFSDYGHYTYLGKRFDVLRGSARFTGGTDMNPLLQLMATYRVQQAGRAPLDIRILIGGTLERPTIALESDAQPTLAQSDLIALLAFGRSSSSLLAFSATALTGGGQGGSSLAGNVAALASRQLASISLGALADQIRRQLSTATGADVLNVRPADIPADLTQGQWETILRGTEIEIGKYVDRRTFVVTTLRPTAIPGALLERRLTPQLELRLNFETRFLPTLPSLGAPGNPLTQRVLGALLSWTVAW